MLKPAAAPTTLAVRKYAVEPIPEPQPIPRSVEIARWVRTAVRLYVSDRAMDEVWRSVGRCVVCGRLEHASKVERGGALVGRYSIDKRGQRFVVVEEALSAPAAPSSPVHIEIRVEDWLPIRARIARAGERRLLGWYHSHPGVGVEMSRVDRRTHERVFGTDWQVALVVDTWSSAHRFFIGAAARRATWVAHVE